MITFNKNWFALVMLILASYGTKLTAQTFWTNDVSVASEWVHSGDSGGGDAVWTHTFDATVGSGQLAGYTDFNSPTVANGFYEYNSDLNGEFTHDVKLTWAGTPINCTGKTGVALKMFTQYAHYEPGTFPKVGVSTNGGTDWTYYNIFETYPVNNQGSPNVYLDYYTVLLPAADNAASVLVQFRWEGLYEYIWRIDDVSLEEYIAPTADMTFRVNMSLETVSPQGVFFASSLNGWTDEPMTSVGNGVYEITKNVAEGTLVEYKFKNGAAGWEGSGLAACGLPPNGNRSLTATATATVLPVVCFNSCDPCVLPCNINPAALICDNFDSYNTTAGIASQNGAVWTTWSNAPGGAEDGKASTLFSSTAPNSLQVTSGGMDFVLKLGNHSTGHYSLKWKMYIPAGNSAYFNIQETAPLVVAAGDFNGEFYFNPGGKGFNAIAGADSLKWTFPYGQWFTFEQVFDLDNNLQTIYVDGAFAGKKAYTRNLGGIDFYSIDASYVYYVDDLELLQLPPVVYNADVCESAMDLFGLFQGTAGVAQISGVQDNTNATLATTDVDPDCFLGASVNNTMWYTFIGTGARYFINTDSCSANYITDGDTQIAIYTGECGNFTQVACNEDIDAAINDFRAGIDFETVAGVTYYMMIDGYNASKGEFCIHVTKVPSITCAQGSIGSYTLDNNGYLCFGEALGDLMELSPDGNVIPNQGPIFGYMWVFSDIQVPTNTFPNATNGFTSFSTGANPAPFEVALTNNGTSVPAGQYYLTPVIVAGATNSTGVALPRINDLDPSEGCVFTGTSSLITVLPELLDLAAATTKTDATPPMGNNGSINLTVGGGSQDVLGLGDANYTYAWSNGATTQDLSGLMPGTYTVTISDISNCGDPIATSVTILLASGVNDPHSLKGLSISPNPSEGLMALSIELEQATEVTIKITNTLGQEVYTQSLGKVSQTTQPMDLTHLPAGNYHLALNIDGEVAGRTLIITK